MEYGLKFNKEDLAEIVTRESRKNAYHPVKTFIESKDWDGVERVESVFIDYLGAEDSHYIRQVTRKWLIAGVTRIYEAGIKFDEMPVLYGKQGAGKSYIADRLAIGKWFKDDIDSFEGKDAKVGLQKAWIVEIAELSAMNKTVIEQTKKFLATRVDDFRPPYARQNIESPRHCVFIGTTNKYDFLKDTTGNRRFLPVAVDASKRIKSLFSDELNDEVVQQIWAEAYHYYKQDEGMKLDAEAEKVAAQTQESHTEDDPLVGEIEDFLNRPITEKYWDLDVYNKREMLYTELFSETLKKNKPYKRDRTCALEIYRVMMANLNSTPKQYETRKINQALDQLDICSKDSNAVQFGRGIGRQRGYTIKLD
ncbi:virulence-associated E family protein [Staphylococcus equorum]|uniref:virulence-associated E family protein n=1 Tax=Staphylococcus TaxID=1279 RepID=UPI00138AEF2B|nr:MULTISPECIES: virulence-associated E family protein [Staphylococcus]MDG0837314.1 virulence-associated E family protein [Staphylococcus equorum]